jgi:hypothetical protein
MRRHKVSLHTGELENLIKGYLSSALLFVWLAFTSSSFSWMTEVVKLMKTMMRQRGDIVDPGVVDEVDEHQTYTTP